MTNENKDGQTGGQKDQEEKEDNTGKQDESQDDSEFSEAQQAKINGMLAAERRKESAKAAQLKKELDALKTKDLPEAQQHKQKAESLEKELAGYKAKELAATIADDLKIPKTEQPKYLKYVTATDENGIKDQLKQLKKDFGSNSTGTGSNPARSGKVNPNDSINSYIRKKAGR